MVASTWETSLSRVRHYGSLNIGHLQFNMSVQPQYADSRLIILIEVDKSELQFMFWSGKEPAGAGCVVILIW